MLEDINDHRYVVWLIPFSRGMRHPCSELESEFKLLEMAKFDELQSPQL